MEAAFVEIGLEKNGFLYVDEIVGPELEGKRHGRKIQDLIKRGQEILVQSVKDPMKSKGARLTTEISLPGRFVVFVPHGEGLGVSRRLEDAERDRLRDIVKAIAPKKGGVIVRTAAEGASDEDVERDLVFLQRLWKSIEANAEKAKAPALVYQEAELPLRVTRDLFTGDFEKAVIDDERTHKRIVGYLKKTSPHMVDRVIRYREKTPLFEQTGVEDAIQSDALTPGRPALRRLPRLRLRRGVHRHRRQHRPLRRLALEELRRAARGHDHGEQPRGRQRGRPPAAAARHRRDHRHRLHRHGEPEEPGDRRGGAEDRARARPDEDLRRRDLAARARRDDAPERDRGPARDPHAEVPDLRRRRDRPLHALGRDRRRAAPAGARCGSKRGVEAYRVEMEENVASHVIGPGAPRLVEIERLSKRRFFIEGKAGAPLDHFKVRAEGKLVDIAPKAPVEEGAEIRIELGEVGKHDVARASASSTACPSPSPTRRSSSARRSRSASSACSTGPRTRRSSSAATAKWRRPITAESEAEKPTARRAQEEGRRRGSGSSIERQRGCRGARASRGGSRSPTRSRRRSPTPRRAPEESRRSRRRKRAAARAAAATGGRSRPAAVAENGEPAERGRERPGRGGADARDDPRAVGRLGQTTDGADADGEQPPKKKRTRRGSRGGRNRRKKPAAASAEAGTESSSG